jgi:hypothetical protein
MIALMSILLFLRCIKLRYRVGYNNNNNNKYTLLLGYFKYLHVEEIFTKLIAIPLLLHSQP